MISADEYAARLRRVIAVLDGLQRVEAESVLTSALAAVIGGCGLEDKWKALNRVDNNLREFLNTERPDGSE